jgi:hypothetical protein
MATVLDDRESFKRIGENLDEIDIQAEEGLERAKRIVRRACYNSLHAWITVGLRWWIHKH